MLCEPISHLPADPGAVARHIDAATQIAPTVPGLSAAPKAVKAVGVVGAGTMGAGIATAFLTAGFDVRLVDRDRGARDRGMASIHAALEKAVAKARLDRATADQARARLSGDDQLASFGDRDLLIEAVYEDLDLKRRIFHELDAVAADDAVLATNTSGLDVDAIAAATGRPEAVVGMHFFSPANVMKLVEIVRARRTGDHALATALHVSRAMGKIAVVAGVAPGFIGNRMLRQRQAVVMQLLLDGFCVARIDAAFRGFGMKMGPFEAFDLAGLDVGWHRDPSRIDTVRDALCAAGRFGQKAGAGFYNYRADRTPYPSTEAAAIIRAFAGRTGDLPQTADCNDQDIVSRAVYPMVNEGYRILEEGKAQRASDLDIVWLHGYGWPRHLGGPMFWAANIEGLDRVVAGLRRHGHAVVPSLASAAIGARTC